MSIQEYQEQFAWNASQGERLSFDISEASRVNNDLVVMRPRVTDMDSGAMLRSQGSNFLSEPEFPNYEQKMMNVESYDSIINDEDLKVFEIPETTTPSNAVTRDTSSKVISDKQDSALEFVSKVVQPIEYEKLPAAKKNAVTLSVKGIYILYEQFVAF